MDAVEGPLGEVLVRDHPVEGGALTSLEIDVPLREQRPVLGGGQFLGCEGSMTPFSTRAPEAACLRPLTRRLVTVELSASVAESVN
ncbi:hypothetical protein [Streptomyces bluensis]|uniref:hypothetical protein n=1 Tax=Streptomyces bluensis TaxID=33897 RepID=UPI0010653E96|nr:hypothetical protein [Streptomyces bluensis]GGZ96681.1 hypothetical protein GCM10010344_76040 [Streptomyces bluensis]